MNQLFHDLTVEQEQERQSKIVADCLVGKCGCPNAEACKLTRCKNCDYPIDANGKTLVDHSCEVELLQVCPDCGGPLNERRIYGAL